MQAVRGVGAWRQCDRLPACRTAGERSSLLLLQAQANQVGAFGPWSDTGQVSTGIAFTDHQSFSTAGAISSTGNVPLVDSLAGATLNYNSSTGILQVSNGASQVASLDFQNSSLGSGTFHAASDGVKGIFITHA